MARRMSKEDLLKAIDLNDSRDKLKDILVSDSRSDIDFLPPSNSDSDVGLESDPLPIQNKTKEDFSPETRPWPIRKKSL